MQQSSVYVNNSHTYRGATPLLGLLTRAYQMPITDKLCVCLTNHISLKLARK